MLLLPPEILATDNHCAGMDDAWKISLRSLVGRRFQEQLLLKDFILTRFWVFLFLFGDHILIG